MSPHVVFAHGFTQTSRSWDQLRQLLADHGVTDSVAVDLPGHGSAAAVAHDLWGSADHLVDAGGVGTYVGYSMGGRVALHAALAHPDAVERLVLIGATAGIDDPDERAARVDSDELLAHRIESIGVEDFVSEWLASPMFAGLDEPRAQRADRHRNTVDGLAASLRRAGAGAQEPVWHRLGELAMPVLILVGEFDSKFRAIGGRLADAIPDVELRVIAGAGHSVHLEQPETTAQALADWLPAA